MKNFNDITKLSLYHYESCPYCAATRNVIDKVGVEVEQRDVLLNPHHRTDLIKGGGKAQVPALRIEREFEQSQWLYESGDINEFLYLYAGQTAYAEVG